MSYEWQLTKCCETRGARYKTDYLIRPDPEVRPGTVADNPQIRLWKGYLDLRIVKNRGKNPHGLVGIRS